MAVSNCAILKSFSCSNSYAVKSFLTTANRGCVHGGIRMSKLGGGKWRMNCGYEDKGHLDYYMVCGEKKKSKGKGNKGWNEMSSKKKIKLLKGLVNDLDEFSELGFGFDVGSDLGFVVDDQKWNVINEAAETLLAQLKQLRAAEDEMKKTQKQEKQKSKTQDSESSSSSESSESSDSECDEVVDMNHLRNKAVVETVKTPEKLSLPKGLSSPKAEQECCNMILDATLAENATIEVLNSETKSLVQPQLNKRIEVCMGGKCKKSGGPALMEELQRVVDVEGAVVGCKCMGKCKSGPNVRVMNNNSDNLADDSLRSPRNPLFIGVGLEDVELIVASFAQEDKDLGLVVAPLHS